MKYALTCFLSVHITICCFAQSEIKPAPELLVADCIPEFPDGEKKLIDFIKKNSQYPMAAIRDSATCKVWVQIEIDTAGKVINAVVRRGMRNDLNEEALRIAKLIPPFIPCKAVPNEKKHNTHFVLPFIFKL